MQLRYRHVEFCVVRILELQKLHVAVAEIHLLEAEISPNDVLRMDHRIAHAQLRQVAHHHFDVARAFL